LMRAKFNNDIHGLNTVLQMLLTSRDSWGFDNKHDFPESNCGLKIIFQ
jgi:exonuclease V gamma subunit